MCVEWCEYFFSGKKKVSHNKPAYLYITIVKIHSLNFAAYFKILKI